MKKVKGWITTTCLATMLMVSASPAKADGVIIAGLTGSSTCTADTAQKVKPTDFGVIIAGFTGVIIAGFTGVIIAGATDQPTQSCGVIIAG